MNVFVSEGHGLLKEPLMCVSCVSCESRLCMRVSVCGQHMLLTIPAKDYETTVTKRPVKIYK